MKRKYFACMMLTAILGATLVGCGKSNEKKTATEKTTDTEMTDHAEETEQSEGVVTLSVWAEEADMDTLDQMLQSFQEQYQDEAQFDISVIQNSEADTKDNLLGDIHNGADIFSFADDQLSAMVAAGALAPVEQADEVKNANVEDAVAAATIHDTLYAYPMTADNGYFLYYNKEYITDEDVKTLDGILDAAAAAGKKFSMDWSSGWYLYSFFGNTGLTLGMNEDGVTNHCDWNATDGAIKGVDIAQAMLDIASNPGFVNTPDSDLMAAVENGSIAALVSGVWNEVAIKKLWGDNYGAVKLPTYTVADQQVQMASFTGYKLMGVNYYSKNKEWAQKLASWLTNEQNQIIRLEQRSQGPSNKNAAQSEYMASVPAIAAVMDQAQYGTLQRVGNSYWDACTKFGEDMANGNKEGKDLQERMDEFVSEITASTVQ